MPAPDEMLAHFEHLSSRWMPAVLEVVEHVIAESTPESSSLLPMARYHFATGGKRLRALIPLAIADALDVDPARVVGFAAACEILHNATLVHDDLQDGDATRRGQPTIWAKWGAPQAINLGDAMLYWTLIAVERVQFDDSAKLRLTQRIVRDTLRVIDGQEREFLLQSERPSLKGYLRMVEGKTSGLFALPMAGTAELCGATDAICRGLRDAAGHLGVLFQLQDDVLDLFGDKGRGTPGSDLGEGKISALVTHFQESAPADDVEWLLDVLRAPREALTADTVSRAATLFRERGSLAWVLGEIDRRALLVAQTPELQDHPALLALVSGLAALFVAPIEAVRG